MNDKEINEVFKELIDLINNSTNEIEEYKLTLTERLKIIPPFHLGDKYTNLDDLVIYINNSFESTTNKRKIQAKVNLVAKKKSKKKKKNKNPDEIFIDKFKKSLIAASVPAYCVTKISTKLNNEWINNILSK